MVLRNAAGVVLLSAVLGGCSVQPYQESSTVAVAGAPTKQQIAKKQIAKQPSRTVTEKAKVKASNSFFPFSFFDRKQAEDEEVVARDDEQEPDEYDLVDFDNELNGPDVKDVLYSQLKEWRSVRYKLGGMSKKGIDCSGFVFLTYRDKFGVELPRNTTYQAQEGDEISQQELQPGDLVFFQVNRRTRHVGIYVEGRKFIHASSKKGVTVSSLDNSYWSRRYWKAVRVDTWPSMM